MEKTPFGEEVFPQLTLSAGVFSKIKMAKVELRDRTVIRRVGCEKPFDLTEETF
jgi:hypothetical protein